MRSTRVYPYKEDYVVKSDIGAIFTRTNTARYRYVLYVPLKNKSNRSVLVILQNPSFADKSKSDYTANNIINYCYNSGYGSVYIMNLFAFCTSFPEDMVDYSKRYSDGFKKIIGIYNNELINEVANITNDIIVAWGHNYVPGFNTLYRKRIREVTDIIRKKDSIYCVVSNKYHVFYPLHGRVWRNRYKLIKWQIPKGLQ